MLVVSLFNGCSSTTTSKVANKKIVIAGIYKAGNQVWFIDEQQRLKKWQFLWEQALFNL